jgi:predicted nucleotidyltransferase component of viral defense system
MITQSHLTAWQHHAPWPKRSQLEQDLRLTRAVAAIFSDSTLAEHVAMRGGTVLHKAHLAPAARYSEDIDLVLIKPMSSTELERHLRRVLTPILGAPSDSILADAWLALRNVIRPSQIMRIDFKFTPLGLQRLETIKVEINLNEQVSLFPLVDVDFSVLAEDGQLTNASARSYDIDELLGTKTRALLQRRQGRDLFDLWHAWEMSSQGLTQFTVDGKRTMQAFDWYLKHEGVVIGQEEACSLLDDRLTDHRFCSDMETLLRPGLDAFKPHEAALKVKEIYLSKLSG